jgi:hypothetical protein
VARRGQWAARASPPVAAAAAAAVAAVAAVRNHPIRRHQVEQLEGLPSWGRAQVEHAVARARRERECGHHRRRLLQCQLAAALRL